MKTVKSFVVEYTSEEMAEKYKGCPLEEGALVFSAPDNQTVVAYRQPDGKWKVRLFEAAINDLAVTAFVALAKQGGPFEVIEGTVH